MHHAHICQWGLQLGNIDIDRVLVKIGTFCITNNLICFDICLTCKSVHLMFMCHFHVIFMSLSSIFGDFTDCHVFHTAHATAKKLRMATWNVFSSLVVTWDQMLHHRNAAMHRWRDARAAVAPGLSATPANGRQGKSANVAVLVWGCEPKIQLITWVEYHHHVRSFQKR